jgi:hypothetical protein
MAQSRSPYSPKDEQKLMTDIWSQALAEDPLAFVNYVFPWGRENTPLEKFSGPRSWQREELLAIRSHIQENKVRMARGEEPLVYKSATASGRGPGKSSLVAWLVLWFMSTRLGGTAIVTANTEAQLKSRTWAELGKWHTLAINGHWFERTALSLKPEPWFESALKKQLQIDTGYYYAQAQLWSEENPDAFAGAHNQAGIMVIFDEASGIPAVIWTVTEGFFTEPVLHRYHFAFSNPRRNTGNFFECFHKFRNFWKRRHLDSRSVEGTDKGVLNSILLAHGEDSDEARVEVKGEFPRQGDKQFIARALVDESVEREIEKDPHAALLMGVDPARYGDDSTVIRFRQGRDARSFPVLKLKGADNMEVANRCAELINKYDPDAVCIDAGNGTGVIDRLREMGFKVHEVWFGGSSPEPEYANFRTYMWAQMRDWIRGGCIDRDDDLIQDLTAPEYKFMGSSDKITLESKEQLKKRGFASPDNGDALACTFAVKVARKDKAASNANARRQRTARDVDYSVFG